MITSINIQNPVLHTQCMDFLKKRHLSFSDFVQMCEMHFLTNKSGIFQKMFNFDETLKMLDFPNNIGS